MDRVLSCRLGFVLGGDFEAVDLGLGLAFSISALFTSHVAAEYSGFSDKRTKENQRVSDIYIQIR